MHEIKLLVIMCRFGGEKCLFFVVMGSYGFRIVHSGNYYISGTSAMVGLTGELVHLICQPIKEPTNLVPNPHCFGLSECACAFWQAVSGPLLRILIKIRSNIYFQMLTKKDLQTLPSA